MTCKLQPKPKDQTEDKITVTTTNNDDNAINQEPKSIPAWYPNHVWSCDLTTVNRWGLWPTYIFVVIDHYSRKVLTVSPLEGPNSGWIITTPTEESARRALAIQLIINKELGLAKNENPLQGSFIIDDLTDLVEEAVLSEFKSISQRGGVLGAMERMYQRSKIQEESLYYESLKHDGKLPIVGVNTFLDHQGSPTIIPAEVRRSTTEEKEFAITSLNSFKKRNQKDSVNALNKIKKTAVSGENIFEQMMKTSKVCTLYQISQALYEVGGQYRRNM